jgi:hypothetical protein
MYARIAWNYDHMCAELNYLSTGTISQFKLHTNLQHLSDDLRVLSNNTYHETNSIDKLRKYKIVPVLN